MSEMISDTIDALSAPGFVDQARIGVRAPLSWKSGFCCSGASYGTVLYKG